MALATASADGDPNVVPMQQCWWYDENTIVVGDFFMNRTKVNIRVETVFDIKISSLLH